MAFDPMPAMTEALLGRPVLAHEFRRGDEVHVKTWDWDHGDIEFDGVVTAIPSEAWLRVQSSAGVSFVV
ncbi:MAG: hypothetical protein KF895_15660, partial [Parvibaculum sp.]|nr:hypothetical protein [Parvibaculum sp.]